MENISWARITFQSSGAHGIASRAQVCGSRWVGIRLDLLSNAIVTCVSLLLVLFRGAFSAGLAGVVVTQAMQLTGLFQYGIRQVERARGLGGERA
jgi:hypothetical protein